MRAALLKLSPSYTDETLPICIGETGWPTSGSPTSDPEATSANAAVFVQNCAAKSKYSMFFFEALDEQRKASTGANGTASLTENHFGWLTEAGHKKYTVPALDGSAGICPQSLARVRLCAAVYWVHVVAHSPTPSK